MSKTKQLKPHWVHSDPQVVSALAQVSEATTFDEQEKANKKYKKIYFLAKTKHDETNAKFVESAEAYGVKAVYFTTDNTMRISGDDARVKSFIRVCCLKGKDAYPFNIAQAK